MRLFIGIDIPEIVKRDIHDYLSSIRTSLKGWENPHDYHQTLLFIGEANETELSNIKMRLSKFHFVPFSLSTSSFEFFNRRIMYLGLKQSRELLKLKEALDVIFPEWIKTETKPFIPHITVKRWQRYEYNDLSEGLSRKVFKGTCFRVDSVCLFKSEKDKLNRKYHVIFRKAFNS